jgi:hypothetical protein
MPLRICVEGIPGSGKTAAIGRLKSGHLYPYLTVVGTNEKKAWLQLADSPAPDTDVIEKAFWKFSWSPRTVAEIEWRVPTMTPFRLTEGSSLTAAYVLAPVLHRHGWLTGETMRCVQRKANEHLVDWSNGRNFVDNWVHLDCFVEDAVGRLKEREATSTAFDEEFILELQDGFLELFYSSQEQAVVGTDFCRHFVSNKNFFDYETAGKDFGPEKVARRILESMAAHLPEERKMFRAGVDLVNIWKKDDEPRISAPWFASARSLAPI